MIYITRFKKHWFSFPKKVVFEYKENAVDYARKYIRLGYWAKVKEVKIKGNPWL